MWDSAQRFDIGRFPDLINSHVTPAAMRNVGPKKDSFWTLILLLIGVGLYLMGSYDGDANQKEAGVRVMKAGLILFLLFGTFFEMIFSSFNHTLFPLLLIGLGAYLVLKRSGRLAADHNHPSDPLPHIR